jgi:hypothetical protein
MKNKEWDVPKWIIRFMIALNFIMLGIILGAFIMLRIILGALMSK